MSYYKTFKPTEEAVKKLRAQIYNINNMDEVRLELYLYCLKNHSEHKMSDVIREIKSLLYSIKFDVISNEYKYAVDTYDKEEDKTIWWCGWQYSRDVPDNSYDEAMYYATEKLSELACIVNTPNWFEDNEDFTTKASEIKSVIEYYVDSVSEAAAYEIFEQLQEFEKRDDIDDSDVKDKENM